MRRYVVTNKQVFRLVHGPDAEAVWNALEEIPDDATLLTRSQVRAIAMVREKNFDEYEKVLEEYFGPTTPEKEGGG